MLRKRVQCAVVCKRFIYNKPVPEFDTDYVCNPKNYDAIMQNIHRRKGVGDVRIVQTLADKLAVFVGNIQEKNELRQKLRQAIARLPNDTHPAVCDNDDPTVLHIVGAPKKFTFKAHDFHEIARRLQLARTEHLGNMSGSRSVYLYGDLAALEHALIKFSLGFLKKQGFKLISVPDMLDSSIVEGCGMDLSSEHTQVYSLDYAKHGGCNLCLSGTAELPIAGFFSNKILQCNQLPMKIAAVSRCYRAEVSSTHEERGIYRLHQFTKVEMFALTGEGVQSEQMLEEFGGIEEAIFTALGLHYKVLDMPAQELGAPAHRKYDIEAWMPGRHMFGEISSCSNCTDYQSRRLAIKYAADGNTTKHVHTVNGTACAVPRMLIALLENYQNPNGFVDIPQALQKYMNGRAKIHKQQSVPELRLIKVKK